MRTETVRKLRDEYIGGPWRLLSPHATMVAVLALGTLILAANAILKVRSVKYVVAMILAGLVVVLVLAVRNRHEILLFTLGLSLPLYAEVILVRSSVDFALTGTFVIAVLLVLSGVVTGTMSWNRFRPFPEITLAGMLFLGACCMSMINTTERTGTVLAICQEAEMIVLFLILVNALQTEEHLLYFLKGFYGSLFVECVLYVIQNATGTSFSIVGNLSASGATNVDAGIIRSQRGTLGASPIVTGMYFGVMTLSLIGIYAARRRPRVGIHPVLGMIMAGGCLVLSAKRSPWSGFAIGVVLMLTALQLLSPLDVGRVRRIVIFVVVSMIPLVPLIVLRSEANHEGDLEERINLMRVVWEMYDSHPIVGVGLGTYNNVKRAYLPEDYQGWLYTVHNRYLLVLAETGVLGLSCLLLVYVMVLYVAWKGLKKIAPEYLPIQVGLMASLVMIHWQMIWEIYDGRQPNYIYWYFASLAVAVPRVWGRDLQPAAPGGGRTAPTWGNRVG